ncbi:MAG: LysM peptidoglycan-binding domain-containing protein [Peptostreptococcaceae bacterium]|uniref:LysM peptidoglycan-binding domain-containing protein n=1 Tax=Zhenhengia sp. TaxID=2944208 RepID=UPI0029114F72|nr:LysM peptidoglycan-binding domain-containing protein [Clostridiales bacterium]MDU7536522.1 LysM peptidoglycan-binding domain-containing protein [Peptostreptococcaceae bacterium]
MQYLFRYFPILILILFSTLSFTIFANEPVLNGIDISEWQGPIDFELVKEDGIEVVYIRAGEGGNYEDAYFMSHYEGAKAANLKIGFYHYVTATSTEEAKEQARYFASLITDKRMDCRPAMDFENFGNLSNNEINAIAKTYLDTLTQLTGITPMLYTDEYNAANLWSSSLNHYPLWIAEYDVITPSSLGPWENWSGFQHSDTGSINGIVGNVDLDYFKESAFITAEESPIPSETHPTPDLKPTPPPVVSTFSTYIVQPGDTLSALALRFHTTVQTLVNLNHIANPNLIYVGQILKIPDLQSAPESSEPTPQMPAPSQPSSPSEQKPEAPSFIYYTVQSGDNLSTIALNYHTTVNTLVRLNHIMNPNLIYIGQVLKIPTSTTKTSQPTFITYIVQVGNTLSGIAMRYNTTASALAKLNHISNPNLIYVGQTLLIPH